MVGTTAVFAPSSASRSSNINRLRDHGATKIVEATANRRTSARPEAKAEPETELKPEAKAGATRLNTSLGDLLVAGLIKDPEDAGRVIAAAISQAEPPNATAAAPEARSVPKAGTDQSKTKAPPDPTPQAAK